MEMLSKAQNLTACLSVAEGAAFSDYIYIFVQTPSMGGDRHYDHTHLNNVLSQLNALKVRNKQGALQCLRQEGGEVFFADVLDALVNRNTNDKEIALPEGVELAVDPELYVVRVTGGK